MKIWVLLAVMTTGFMPALGQQTIPYVWIMNDSATSLPKPAYPSVPLDACARGQVSVKVLISKDGRVKDAEAISGNQFFRGAAVAAAKQARFRSHGHAPPMERTGLVVYNFPPSKGCGKRPRERL
ncbi:MAG: energy transducer TonB [Chloracidobacterium sp.]|nr:energy transducer TonB [Chloracidobacterium sp.]